MTTALINEYSSIKSVNPSLTAVTPPALVRSATEAAAAEKRRPLEAPVEAPPGLRDFTLRFSVDQDSGEVVVSVVDPETGDLLRQIPTEDALRLAKALESIGKNFLDDRA